MTNLVFINDNKAVTDSLVISEVFGKRHDLVTRDIAVQIQKLQEAGESEWGVLNFEETQYQHQQNKQWYPKYNLTEEAFTIVAMSYVTPEAMKMKVRFIEEFKRMREYIKKQQEPPLTEEQKLREHLKLSIATSERVDQVETKIVQVTETVQVLLETMRIDSRQEYAIKAQGKAKVIEVLGGYDSPAYKKLGRKVFSKLWGDFKRHFVLPRSTELAKKDFDEAVRFIAIWRPDTSMMMEIDTCNRQVQLKLVQ